MLETVQISDPARVLRRYPHELSGGQQQRVMFAMALATDPELLVLDEPTTGLDATVEAEVLDLVEQLREGFDAAILFVSHNLGVVARVCERVGVLYAGRLVEQGPARELFTDPAPSLHAGAPALRAAARDEQGRRPARPDPRVAPAARCRRRRLRLRRPLPARPRCVPRGPAAAGVRWRGHSPGGLPLPGRGAGDPARRRAGATAARPSWARRCSTSAAWPRRTSSAGRSWLRSPASTSSCGSARCSGWSASPARERRRSRGASPGWSSRPTGSVRFDGQDVTVRAERSSREVRRRLQMVFQNPDNALNPRHTVRAILRRSLRLLAGVSGRDRQEQEMLELARSVRLEPRHLDVRPAALSGGLKQRVAIARSFSGQPALVLCDEPTSALDVSVQAAILNLLVDLQRDEGVSYIFISHDLAVVRYVADTIGVMYLGQLVDVGPAAAVFSRRTTRTPRRCSRRSRRSISTPARASSSPARSRARSTLRRGAGSTPAARGSWARSARRRSRRGRRTRAGTGTAATSRRPSWPRRRRRRATTDR